MAQKRQRNRGRGRDHTNNQNTTMPSPPPETPPSSSSLADQTATRRKTSSTTTANNNTTSSSDTTNATTDDYLPDPQTYAELKDHYRNKRRGRLVGGGGAGDQLGRSPRSNKIMSLIDCLGIFIAIGIVILFLMLIWEVVIPTEKQRIYTGVLMVSLIPVFLIIYTSLLRGQKPLHQRVTPLAMVFAIVGGLFPSWFTAGIAAIGLFGFGWVTRPGIKLLTTTTNKEVGEEEGDDDEKKKLLSSSLSNTQSTTATSSAGAAGVLWNKNNYKAALSGIAMLMVLLIENFFVWIVSATFEKGWDPKTAPDPLQDNGRRVLLHMFTKWFDFTKRDVVSLRRIWNVQYALVASLGVGLLTADFHPTRQLWSLASRGLLTITFARVLRTISFCLTVLPSQNKFCYYQHYGPEPPPPGWYDWLMVGVIPASSGGCNDLIVSGHATVTTTMACVSVSLADDHLFSIAVAWLLGMDYLVEVYEGFHYSVDMWMGAILCSLLWRVLKPIEDNNTDRNAATLQDMMNRFKTDPITIRDIVVYGGPVFLAYLQVTAFPEYLTNFVLFGIATWSGLQMITQGFHHYTKHLLFCALYIGIGIYL